MKSQKNLKKVLLLLALVSPTLALSAKHSVPPAQPVGDNQPPSSGTPSRLEEPMKHEGDSKDPQQLTNKDRTRAEEPEGEEQKEGQDKK